MASELTVTQTFVYTPTATNVVALDPPDFSKSITMTGSAYVSHVMSIAATEVEVVLDATSTALTASR